MNHKSIRERCKGHPNSHNSRTQSPPHKSQSEGSAPPSVACSHLLQLGQFVFQANIFTIFTFHPKLCNKLNTRLSKTIVSMGKVHIGSASVERKNFT